MTQNAILSLYLRNRTLDPAQAEVHVHVTPTRRTPTTEVRGRLVGPRCAYASTVEVAYPLRPLPRPPADRTDLIVRVVIPEPSIWDLESPFFYDGIIVLWEDGQRGDQETVRHGLRTFQLGRPGLRINHRPVPIRGAFCDVETEQELQQQRDAGRNLVVAPLSAGAVWEAADRVGLLVLGRADSPAALCEVSPLARHPCCLGFLLPEAALAWGDVLHRTERPPFLGVMLTRVPTSPLPQEIDFLVCSPALLPHLGALDRPRLVLTANDPAGGKPDTAGTPGTIGWLQNSPS